MIKHLYFTNDYIIKKPTYYFDGTSLHVKNPWDMIRNPILRKICHSHISPKNNSKHALPLRCIWNKKILGNFFDGSDKQYLIINSHFYQLISSGLLDYFRKKYLNGITVFVFSDKVDYFAKHYKNFPSMDTLKDSFNIVLTYNEIDAKEYNILLEKPCFPLFDSLLDIDMPSSDVFFVGRDKGRLTALLKLYDNCVSKGLKCLFYISGVDIKKEILREGVVYNKQLSYSEVISCVKRTKCVVNIVQNGTCGITMRDYEAFYYRKILLTDNHSIENMPFFNKNMVIWLEDAETELDRIFEKKEFHFNLSDYDLASWYRWIDTLY